jgi:hypothetical protein
MGVVLPAGHPASKVAVNRATDVAIDVAIGRRSHCCTQMTSGRPANFPDQFGLIANFSAVSGTLDSNC